jgi:hypothetical protein
MTAVSLCSAAAARPARKGKPNQKYICHLFPFFQVLSKATDRAGARVFWCASLNRRLFVLNGVWTCVYFVSPHRFCDVGGKVLH